MFVEASAKTGENVQEVFMQVVSPGRFGVGLDDIVNIGTIADLLLEFALLLRYAGQETPPRPASSSYVRWQWQTRAKGCQDRSRPSVRATSRSGLQLLIASDFIKATSGTASSFLFDFRL